MLGVEPCVRATGAPNHGAISPAFLKEWCACASVSAEMCMHMHPWFICVYICAHVNVFMDMHMTCTCVPVEAETLVFDDILHRAGAHWFSFAGGHCS